MPFLALISFVHNFKLFMETVKEIDRFLPLGGHWGILYHYRTTYSHWILQQVLQSLSIAQLHLNNYKLEFVNFLKANTKINSQAKIDPKPKLVQRMNYFEVLSLVSEIKDFYYHFICLWLWFMSYLFNFWKNEILATIFPFPLQAISWIRYWPFYMLLILAKKDTGLFKKPKFEKSMKIFRNSDPLKSFFWYAFILDSSLKALCLDFLSFPSF